MVNQKNTAQDWEQYVVTQIPDLTQVEESRDTPRIYRHESGLVEEHSSTSDTILSGRNAAVKIPRIRFSETKPATPVTPQGEKRLQVFGSTALNVLMFVLVGVGLARFSQILFPVDSESVQTVADHDFSGNQERAVSSNDGNSPQGAALFDPVVSHRFRMLVSSDLENNGSKRSDRETEQLGPPKND